MPTDDFGASKDRKEAPVQQQQEARDTSLPVPPASPEASSPQEAPAASKKAEKYQPKPVSSVLEKLRLYAGEKTPKNLVALFDSEPGAPFSQSPLVAFPDGKATITVLITRIPGDRAPNFSFSNARYVSLQQAGDGEWQMEVRPDKGAIKASISMLTDGAHQDIPLTVSPQANIDLDKSGSVTEEDFLLFLKSRGTEKAPLYDLNGDGKRDYQDDYIFTANYLVKKDQKKAPAQKKP